jgi:hypothetical protein
VASPPVGAASQSSSLLGPIKIGPNNPCLHWRQICGPRFDLRYRTRVALPPVGAASQPSSLLGPIKIGPNNPCLHWRQICGPRFDLRDRTRVALPQLEQQANQAPCCYCIFKYKHNYILCDF